MLMDKILMHPSNQSNNSRVSEQMFPAQVLLESESGLCTANPALGRISHASGALDHHRRFIRSRRFCRCTFYRSKRILGVESVMLYRGFIASSLQGKRGG